jgi:hypothetical protein
MLYFIRIPVYSTVNTVSVENEPSTDLTRTSDSKICIELSLDNRNPWDTVELDDDTFGFVERPAKISNSNELRVNDTLGVRYPSTE